MYFGRVTVLTYQTCHVSLATTSVTQVIVESFLHLFCWLYFACFHFLTPLGEVCSIQHLLIKFVGMSVALSGYSSFLHYKNWPPLYNYCWKWSKLTTITLSFLFSNFKKIWLKETGNSVEININVFINDKLKITNNTSKVLRSPPWLAIG